MPTPSNPSMIDQQVNLAEAPGSDFSFDDLFATPGEVRNQQTAPQPAAAPEQPLTPPQAAPIPPVDPEPFLRTQASVYKTREEAERGFSEKDTAINRLRQYAIDKTGFDPLTGKQTAAPTQAAPQVAPTDVSKTYWDELTDAANKGDYSRYADTQRRFAQQVINEALAPVAPLISEVARQRAVRTVSQANAEIQQWVGSNDYNQFLSQSPVLSAGIANAEQNAALYEQLPELYNIAYLAYQGRRLPDILRQQQAATPAVIPPPTATVGQSTLTPPNPSQFTNPADALRSREGRRETIERFEKSGKADLDLTLFR